MVRLWDLSTCRPEVSRPKDNRWSSIILTPRHGDTPLGARVPGSFQVDGAQPVPFDPLLVVDAMRHCIVDGNFVRSHPRLRLP